MITIQKLQKFLTERPALSVAQIEKESGMPARTLHRSLSTKSQVPENHLANLEAVLINYGYSDIQKAVIISFVNHKGGVGKTTTTINVGKALSLMGNKVLLIDMDSQGNLSQCFGFHLPEKQVINALLDGICLPIEQITETLFLSPSTILMEDRQGEFSNVVGAERRLLLKIKEIENNFDFILIDCPPSLGICTLSALTASNFCVIPIQPEASAYHGVDNLFKKINEIQTYSNSGLRVKGIVFTMVLKQNLHREIMEQIREKYKHFKVFSTMIDNIKYVRESQAMEQDLFTYNAESISWKQYKDFTNELLTT